MKPRIFGLENEYGLIFSPNGRIYLPIEKILGYIFEGLIPNSWPSNAFLVNGARFYQDTGCHPEYSTPECDNIEDLVLHDKAGERLLEACLPAAEERLREEGLSGEIYIFKNNTDSLGNTYGCHENFLMRRGADFWEGTEQLIPFFVHDLVPQHHQHPRRAPRRRGEIPPAPHHRGRFQHVGDRDLPEGRDRRAGPLDDRGRLHRVPHGAG